MWLPEKTDSPLRFSNKLRLHLRTNASLHFTLRMWLYASCQFASEKVIVLTFRSGVLFSRFATPFWSSRAYSQLYLPAQSTVATRRAAQLSASRHGVLSCVVLPYFVLVVVRKSGWSFLVFLHSISLCATLFFLKAGVRFSDLRCSLRASVFSSALKALSLNHLAGSLALA